MCIGKEYHLGAMVKKNDFLNYLKLKFNIADDDLYYQIIDELKEVLTKTREKIKKSQKLATKARIERDQKHSTANFKPIFNKVDLTYTIFDKTIYIFENGMEHETITNSDFKSIVRVRHDYISNANIDKIYNEILSAMKTARFNYLSPYFKFYFIPFILNLSTPLSDINESMWTEYCRDNHISFKVSFFDGFIVMLNQIMKTLSKPKNIKKILLPHIITDAIAYGYNGYVASDNVLIEYYKNKGEQEKTDYPLEIHLIKNNHIDIDFQQLHNDFLALHNEALISDIISLLRENDMLDEPIDKNCVIELLKDNNLIPSINIDEMIHNIENELKLKQSNNNFLIVLNFTSNIKNLDISFYDENLIIDDIYDDHLIMEETSTAQLISEYTDVLITKAKELNQVNNINHIKIYKKSSIMGREFISNKTLYKNL